MDFKYEDSKKFKFLKENKIENNSFQDNALINLNNAFTINNYKIYIEKNYKVKKPLVIYHTTNSELNSTNINIQLNFLLEKTALLKLSIYSMMYLKKIS